MFASENVLYFIFNYPERLREGPYDVLATCTTCYKGANSYLPYAEKIMMLLHILQLQILHTSPLNSA